MRIVKLVAVCLIPGVLLGLMGFEGLAKVGVVRDLFAPTIAGDLDAARSSQSGYRVLFVGNSLTYTTMCRVWSTVWRRPSRARCL